MNRAGRLLDQRNSLKALHGAGNRSGFHGFRRFRFSVLRRTGVPENLIKLFAELDGPLRHAITARRGLRREWCEKAGLRLELGDRIQIGGSNSPVTRCVSLSSDKL